MADADAVSIIVPAFNQLEYCRQCIDSIRANTPRPHQLILVDNGSTDGVGEFFDAVPGARVVHAGSNRGFAGGVNLGLEHAEGHVVLLNSDTITPAGWLERLEAALLEADDVGMVGPMSNCVSGPQQIDGLALDSMDAINAFARDLAHRNAGKRQDTQRLVGFCLMIRDRVVATVGRFDEAFGIGNFEDDDYGLRVIRAGFRLRIAEDAFVFHFGSRTFLGMGVTDAKWRDLIDTNERRFREKWRIAPPDRSECAERSRELNEAARRALEAGEHHQALKLLKDAIEAFPLLEQNYNDVGVTLWRLGERTRSLEYFSRALRLNPDYAEARDNLHMATASLKEHKPLTTNH